MSHPIAPGQVWEHRRSGVRVTVVRVEEREPGTWTDSVRIQRRPDVPDVGTCPGKLWGDYWLVETTGGGR